MQVKILTKKVVTKNKGMYVRIRHIYRIFGIPIFFRDDRISYAKKLLDENKRLIYGGVYTMENIGEYIVKSPDILQKVQDLLRGLTPKEAGNALKIINRLKESYLNPLHCVEVHSTQEIQALDNVKYEFYANIMQITNDVWSYQGYFLPNTHFGANAFLYKHGLNLLESSTLQKMRNKDFIDVGGYIGDSAIIFEREFCDKLIHTFEATKTNFALMKKTLELNKSKRIVPVNKGLGAKEEKLEICVAGGSSSINDELKNTIDSTHIEIAEIITLDSYVEANNVDVGFIKVDIEGFEQEFLKGAVSTIKKFRPAMLISIYHNANDFFNIKPMIESWNLGYSFKFDKPIDGSVGGEVVLYCEILD